MKKKVTAELIKQICKMYQDGYGTCELANLFNLNRWTIFQYLKKSNLDPKRITRPYKNKYDIHFFEKYSQESAYWAGFILADGNIHSKKKILQIALNKQDDDHLIKFAKAIKFIGPIYTDITNDSRKICISGKWFAVDLQNLYGIGSKKSLTITWPEQLPKEYWSSFIRGIFDGDGSISLSKDIIVISFTGTRKLLLSLIDIFYNLGVVVKNNNGGKPSIQHKANNFVVGQFALSGKNANIVINWMYQNSSDQNRLTRKYERYEKKIG